MHTTHFIVNLFMSKVYNESCFKMKQHVSHLFLWICIINYAELYKSSHAVFYDLVMTILQVRMPNEYFIHVISLLILPTDLICSLYRINNIRK